MNYEKGNKETIIVKNGDSWTGVDGFWDSEKQQWYKITDNIDVELTPDGGVRWSPGKHATPGGKFKENQMNLSFLIVKIWIAEESSSMPNKNPTGIRASSLPFMRQRAARAPPRKCAPVSLMKIHTG